MNAAKNRTTGEMLAAFAPGLTDKHSSIVVVAAKQYTPPNAESQIGRNNELELSTTAVIALIGLALAVLTAFAGIVAGFVRLETRTNTHTDSINDLYKHVEDRQIHHPADELDRRFNVVESGMTEIKKGIDKLVERFDRFISK